MRKWITAVLVAGLSVASTYGANLADDTAASSAYDDGWQTSDNGGSGWGAWTLGTTSGNSGENGHFMGSSTNNADQSDDGVIGGLSNDQDIDTGGRSWGMYANSSQTADATRPFSGGALSVGQTLSITFDNGFIDGGATVGLGVQNSSNENLWEFIFTGGNSFYQMNQLGGLTNTSLGFASEGMTVDFTLTAADAYDATVTLLNGTSDTISGSLLSPAGGQSVDQVRAFNFNAGSGDSQNIFINTMSVVPEPSSMLLVLMGLMGIGIIRKRRQL